MEFLRKANCLLRPWEIGDRYELVKALNNPHVLQYLGERIPFPYHLEDADQWISFCKSKIEVHDLAIEVGGQVAGAISLVPQEDVYKKSMEMGYWLAEPHWGKGIMLEAIHAMVEYGFSHFPVNRIFARPFGVNKQSIRVLEKAGFAKEGHFKKAVFKDGRYLDALLYALLKEEEDKK